MMRLIPAQNSLNRKRALKFPIIVTYRHTKAKIYAKSDRYPYYRVTCRAEGKRLVRSFSKFGEARLHAERVLREIASGNDGAIAMSP